MPPSRQVGLPHGPSQQRRLASEFAGGDIVRLLPMRQSPQNCHWSVPTLLMPRPYWFSADDDLWCCWNDHQIVVLTSTDICRTCPMWKPSERESTALRSVPAEGAMPFKEP